MVVCGLGVLTVWWCDFDVNFIVMFVFDIGSSVALGCAVFMFVVYVQ